MVFIMPLYHCKWYFAVRRHTPASCRSSRFCDLIKQESQRMGFSIPYSLFPNPCSSHPSSTAPSTFPASALSNVTKSNSAQPWQTPPDSHPPIASWVLRPDRCTAETADRFRPAPPSSDCPDRRGARRMLPKPWTEKEHPAPLRFGWSAGAKIPVE